MVDADLVLKKSRIVEVFDDRIFLRSDEISQGLQIKFKNLEINVEESNTKGFRQIPFYALYGIITLKKHSYLILITKANLLDLIIQKQIFQVEQITFVPLANTNQIASEDLLYTQMIEQRFSTKSFYFSYQYDLSQTLQRFVESEQQMQKKKIINIIIFSQYHPQFTFNRPLLERFMSQVDSYQVRKYWLNVFISGCILFKYCKLPGNFDCSVVLISRRDFLRSGMRFIQRGADYQGNCSNFAETEQILVREANNQYQVYSYVQTRGSMPFSWRQDPSLKWSPKAHIRGDRQSNIEIYKKHLSNQQKYFQNQVLVNLIDKKGTQKMLGEYFTSMVNSSNLNGVKYVWFDFHHECRKMKYENLSKLIESIKLNLEGDGYFAAKLDIKNAKQYEIQSRQIGTIRTNCMDCLDRTNVVQSAICRNVVLRILKQLNVIPSLTGQTFQSLPGELEQFFRETWTKNADVMSMLYSGTGALKTDFTLTGKRTFQGAIQDGRNSIHRYFLNNFYDVHNQNSIDLLVGKINPRNQNLKKQGANGLFFLIIILFIAFYVGFVFVPHYILKEEHAGITGVATFTALFITFVFSRVLMQTHKLFLSTPVIKQ